MPLRKQRKESAEAPSGPGEAKRSKRERLRHFFRRKQKDQQADAIPAPVKNGLSPRKPARDSKIADSPRHAKSKSSVDVTEANVEKVPQAHLPRADIDAEKKDKEQDKAHPLSEDHIHALFSGAPHFSIRVTDNAQLPAVTYPWDAELKTKDVSDSLQLAQPAYSAATLHPHLTLQREVDDHGKRFQGYDIGQFEVPSMLSAQGIEPGTVGFHFFLELPMSDYFVTNLQQSQSSNGFLEGVRNKEQMQSNPEKLGIRRFDRDMMYDRLVELGDLVEAFHDSPERMTILNNQSSGDLYANLFGKFLSPPKFDGATDDPTGIKVQIDALLKILRLRGIWYDFSLVEWRIRLGQILWSDPDLDDHDSRHRPLWTNREILLLQILLSCELLLRLDAVSSMDAETVIDHIHVNPQEWQGFLKLKTRKTDWDLVLARRFLDNILVVKESDKPDTPSPRKRTFLSILSREEPQETQEPDIVFLPRHQNRQLTGFIHFAETLQWPGLDAVVKDMARKLGVMDPTVESNDLLSPYGSFLEPNTPTSMSVYGTPLASPHPTNGMPDGYFGRMSKPEMSRSDSRSLKVPLTSTILEQASNTIVDTSNIGGWLSRSFLTGFILPGEAISHFLMSTLLENDKLAIAALGDSANLYGGFIYSEKSWWSKASVVGRVLGCLEGTYECMGWLCISKLPEGGTDGWFATNERQLLHEQPPRISSEVEKDFVAADSAIVPSGIYEDVKPEDLTLPVDPSTPPIPSIEFTKWQLTPVVVEFSETVESPGSGSEPETFMASLTFTSFNSRLTHTFTLSNDIQFVTSFPCTPPTPSSPAGIPQILKRSLSRSSSKRSVHSTKSGSNRPSRRPSRRNSHGYEPLMSHPPESPSLGPTRAYSPVPDEDLGETLTSQLTAAPMTMHPLHMSYKYKMVPVSEILDLAFQLPFKMPEVTSPAPSSLSSPLDDNKDRSLEEDRTVLILDARSSRELELLARAWCAEKGLHAIVGRVGRTCVACCVREARGLGIKVVIRI
ncbi:hypothetical protein EJ04DRAFT_487877 [Polyplosphaeria fusca]|uniref:Uncharacterized protein n=1 Tax=Polyplosphaeria fusca TaxID=682080 RepID=A0A9P4V5L3_9PLEO|nr:hypothetical protein EJ04DRAFT_487877 [Polyplosphaeria fusca]